MPAKPNHNGDDLEQIRELIFGHQLKQVGKQINDLKNEIKLINKKLSDLVNHSEQRFEDLGHNSKSELIALKDTIDNSIKETKDQLGVIQNDLSQQINKLSLEKSDQSLLSDYFIEIGTKLKNK